VADRALTGVLLVGGASRRFGSPKALATLGGETLAERAWRTLAFCDERLAVGKADEFGLPFPVLEDGVDLQAPIAGVVGGLRAASHELVAVLPVDMPLVTADVLRRLAAACRDAAVPQTGPLPCVYARRTLPVLERRLAAGDLSLRDALSELDVAEVAVDEALLANVNTPEELAALSTKAFACDADHEGLADMAARPSYPERT
jgi:molybdopterin-guanine dinucleotide biosynthesis protein A